MKKLLVGALFLVACAAPQVRRGNATEAECEANFQHIIDREGTTLEEDLRDFALENERCTEALEDLRTR